MSDDKITFEVDGNTLEGKPGDMLIEVTDKAGINIPRFCYHRKLSIAANCRMCLVEVERAPKPLPACSTPISEGMKVSTRSPKAISAQRATMEFLLINHPLDCPICDQGGECELQDVAMGYGDGVGQYSEAKRVVKDKDIGPLIATDMTRCIHCTRCVRFGEEIAGLKELGATGRSDQMEIGTYISKSVTSELSGNVIDLCPVGALTAKPSRYTHRPWELLQHKHVSMHDAFGANTYLHTRGTEVMRVVPRENEAVNETWIADRDRFSYTGLTHESRLEQPMVKRNGQWQVADWDEALSIASEQFKNTAQKHGPNAVGALVSGYSSLEEQFLTQKLIRGLGSNNIDHRVGRQDFSLDAEEPVMPWLGMDIQDISSLESALVVGCALREEIPLFGHRLRQTALDNQAKIGLIHPFAQKMNFPVRQFVDHSMLSILLGWYQELGAETPEALKGVEAAVVTDEMREQIQALQQSKHAAIFLGALAQADKHYHAIYSLVSAIADKLGVKVGLVPTMANQAGAYLAGALPHRAAGGAPAVGTGLNAAEMLANPPSATLLVNLEPELDAVEGHASIARLRDTDCVVVLSSFVSDAMRDYADVILPISSPAETAGTWVNAEGRWQSVNGVVKPLGQARPAWKVLRVMGNLLDLGGFDYMANDEIRRDVQQYCANVELNNSPGRLDALEPVKPSALGDQELHLINARAMYAIDPIVRRAEYLQQTELADKQRCILMHPDDAERTGVQNGAQVTIKAGSETISMPVRVDNLIKPGSALIYRSLSTSKINMALQTVAVKAEVAA